MPNSSMQPHESTPIPASKILESRNEHGIIVQILLAEPFPWTVTQGVVLLFLKEFSGL